MFGQSSARKTRLWNVTTERGRKIARSEVGTESTTMKEEGKKEKDWIWPNLSLAKWHGSS